MSDFSKLSEDEFERPRKRVKIDSGKTKLKEAPVDKKLLNDLSPGHYVSMIDRFRGPEVTIFIGEMKKEYILPKSVVCYSSEFFDRAFNGGFKEGHEQKIHLEECTVEVFDKVTQWMYTGSLVHENSKAGGSAKIQGLLEFLVIADYIKLLGPFKSVILKMEELLLGPTAINSGHIRTAFLLPSRHTARKLVADACVKTYVLSLRRPRHKFKFKREMDEVEGFAADLLKSHTKAVQRPYKYYTSVEESQVDDPLTGQALCVYNWRA